MGDAVQEWHIGDGPQAPIEGRCQRRLVVQAERDAGDAQAARQPVIAAHLGNEQRLSGRGGGPWSANSVSSTLAECPTESANCRNSPKRERIYANTDR